MLSDRGRIVEERGIDKDYSMPSKIIRTLWTGIAIMGFTLIRGRAVELPYQLLHLAVDLLPGDHTSNNKSGIPQFGEMVNRDLSAEVLIR